MSSVSNGLYFLTLPLVSVMRVIYRKIRHARYLYIKRNVEKVWGARYTLGARYLSKNTVSYHNFVCLKLQYICTANCMVKSVHTSSIQSAFSVTELMCCVWTGLSAVSNIISLSTGCDVAPLDFLKFHNKWTSCRGSVTCRGLRSITQTVTGSVIPTSWTIRNKKYYYGIYTTVLQSIHW